MQEDNQKLKEENQKLRDEEEVDYESTFTEAFKKANARTAKTQTIIEDAERIQNCREAAKKEESGGTP